jgi:hypothetical protein
VGDPLNQAYGVADWLNRAQSAPQTEIVEQAALVARACSELVNLLPESQVAAMAEPSCEFPILRTRKYLPEHFQAWRGN